MTAGRVVSVRELSFTFGEGRLRKQILFNVDLDIERGEIVLLTGPSGSGKTTLLTLIGALRSLQTGSVRVLGTELRGATAQQQVAVRRRLGFIFQSHNLHRSLTARQNVRLALELHPEMPARDMDQAVREMLHRVGLAHRLEHVPAQLSGGEKQRVAVARALVARPDLVLADEPSAALDKTTGRNVVELMRQLAQQQGSAVLLVTHDNRILDIADRILDMEDGRIIRAQVRRYCDSSDEEAETPSAAITREPPATDHRGGDRDSGGQAIR